MKMDMETAIWIFSAIICILILLKLLQLIIKHRRTIYIVIVCFPRDIYGLYLYSKINVFAYYCKFTNQTAARYFDSSMRKRKLKPCFYFEDEIWTYHKVQQESYKVARYFKRKGYKKGDVVGLFMENCPDYVCIWLGLSRLGVVTSLLNYNLRLESLEHCVKVSQCKAVIFGTELTHVIQEIVEEGGFQNIQLLSYDNRVAKTKLILPTESEGSVRKCVDLSEKLSKLYEQPIEQLRNYDDRSVNNSDQILLIFTSGTTGMPKASRMSHSRMIVYSGCYYPAEMNSSKDIILTPIPLYHVHGGVIGTTCALFHGVPQVILQKFSCSKFWTICIQYKVTMVQYMGEIIRYLYSQPERPQDTLHSVKIFFGSGVNSEIWGKFVKRFNISKIKEMYGSTEGTCNIMNVEGHEKAIGYLPLWAYPILPIYRARVDTITGELIRDPLTGLVQHTKNNQPGEVMSTISLRNPLREFNGYTDEEATNKKIVRDVKTKGDMWFRTGDMVTQDEYGYFYFKDRSGDTFKWKGENVSTAEVEQVVARGTDFKSATVYGVQVEGHEGRCGMVAISDPEETLDLQKLAQELLRSLPSYARPLFLRVLNTEIEMTGTFKLQKRKLQLDGYQSSSIEEKIYFFNGKEFIPLTDDICKQIQDGKIRL